MVLEKKKKKNEPPRCLEAQNFQHRWVLKYLMYKIEPASCACSPSDYQAITESVLPWPGHWSCSVCKTQYMKVQETILKAFFGKGKMPNCDHSDLTLKLTPLWTR